jgi:hypothetical protein
MTVMVDYEHERRELMGGSRFASSPDVLIII